MKKLLVATPIALAFTALLMLLALPVFNPLNPGFLALLLPGLVVFAIITGMMEVADDDEHFGSTIASIVIVVVIIASLLIGGIASLPCFHANDKVRRLDVETVETLTLPDYKEDGSFMLLSDTNAMEIASRSIGQVETSGLYAVSGNVTTMAYNGKLVKVIPLEYTGFHASRQGNIPGYVIITDDGAEFVEAEFKFSPSGYWGNDLKRCVRKEVNQKLGEMLFEISPEGKPYWTVQILNYSGAWSTKYVAEVALVDAMTGDVEVYDVDKAPEWVVVYSLSDMVEYYNDHGSYINGAFNWSRKGETQVSASFSNTKDDKTGTQRGGAPVLVNGRVFYYTGITSVTMSGDESNIGILLFDAANGTAKYQRIGGTEEFSAMAAAEGMVQNYGYTANYPVMLNINGTMSYVMALKDGSNLTKKIAIVGYEDYQNIAIGDTIADAVSKYSKYSDGKVVVTEEQKQDIVVDEVQFIAINGDTVTYIRSGSVWFKAEFEEWHLTISGTTIHVVVYGDGEVKFFKR